MGTTPERVAMNAFENQFGKVLDQLGMAVVPKSWGATEKTPMDIDSVYAMK